MRKCTLRKEDDGKWHLVDDATRQVLQRFPTKEHAIRRGALEKALGEAGGSVRIRKLDGTFSEERTYPRSADPRRSPD